MKKVTIKVEKIHEDAVVPEFAHDTDSGFDIFTCENTTVKAGKKAIIPTGLKLELPYGYGVQIKNKSGITIKGCPICSNDGNYRGERADITVFEGTVDMMYRGEIGIMIKNEEGFDITIPKHIKIAQGVIREIITCDFVEVDHVSTDTERADNGYGSSGISK